MTNQAVRNELLDVLTDKPSLIDPVEQAIQYERELLDGGRFDEYTEERSQDSDVFVRGWDVMDAGIPPKFIGTLVMTEVVDRVYSSNSGSSFRFTDLDACEEACQDFRAMMEDVAQHKTMDEEIHTDEDYILRIEEEDGFFYIVQEKPGVGEMGRIEVPPNVVDELVDSVREAERLQDLRRRYG